MEGAPQGLELVGEILGACPSVEETWSWLQGNQRTRSYWAGGEEAPPAVEGLRTSSSSTSSSSARGSGARPMVVPTLIVKKNVTVILKGAAAKLGLPPSASSAPHCCRPHTYKTQQTMCGAGILGAQQTRRDTRYHS